MNPPPTYSASISWDSVLLFLLLHVVGKERQKWFISNNFNETFSLKSILSHDKTMDGWSSRLSIYICHLRSRERTNPPKNLSIKNWVEFVVFIRFFHFKRNKKVISGLTSPAYRQLQPATCNWRLRPPGI